MTSPRSYDGVGYPSPSPSSGTPIYDSLVAERGIPQIAPINVPPALPATSWSSSYGSGFGGHSGGFGTGFDSPASNLPALPPARLALGPGPSSSPVPAPHIPVQPGYAQAPMAQPTGYAQAPQNFAPGQRPTAPAYPQPGQQYQAQAPANGFAAAPQSFTPTFNSQQFGAQPAAPQQQTFGDQSFGGNGLRPTAPQVRQPGVGIPQQYPQQYRQYPQAG
ncbi:DUF6643 family protein [Kitasatospora sp. NPDC088134]|uniref:DUF6643 family protein n=1 Tax=Kitasatospora sp. NPDC088134 TaxID=3364071 RepID=UPI0037F1B438